MAMFSRTHNTLARDLAKGYVIARCALGSGCASQRRLVTSWCENSVALQDLNCYEWVSSRIIGIRGQAGLALCKLIRPPSYGTLHVTDAAQLPGGGQQ